MKNGKMVSHDQFSSVIGHTPEPVAARKVVGVEYWLGGEMIGLRVGDMRMVSKAAAIRHAKARNLAKQED